MGKIKINKFTDLACWQKGHQLVLDIYHTTNTFPKTETYTLVDQMRRAVISITSNIAEGFNRRSQKEKIQFYYIALGSLTEIQNQLIIAKDVSYIDTNKFQLLTNNTVIISKLINGLIKSIKQKTT